MLLTGGTGFVGRHVIERLLARGHLVSLLVRAQSDLSRLKGLDRIEKLDRDDVLSRDDLRTAGRFDAIVHLATVYGRGTLDVQQLIDTNIRYPARLLQLAIRAQVPLFINTDTYSTKGVVSFSHLPAYCLSKTQFAQWAALMSGGTATHLACMRLEHVYGPYDAPDKFTRWVIRSCLEATEPLKMTAGSQERDFIFIGDAADAYVRVVESGGQTAWQEYEVGSGRALSVRDWVQKAHALTGARAELRFGALPYREGEIISSKADTAALQRLGWRPATPLDEGMRQTIEWEQTQIGGQR